MLMHEPTSVASNNYDNYLSEEDDPLVVSVFYKQTDVRVHGRIDILHYILRQYTFISLHNVRHTWQVMYPWYAA